MSCPDEGLSCLCELLYVSTTSIKQLVSAAVRQQQAEKRYVRTHLVVMVTSAVVVSTPAA